MIGAEANRTTISRGRAQVSETRCLELYVDDQQCERWAGHKGDHFIFPAGPSETGILWSGPPVPCKNCGEPIHVPPNDYLRRYVHLETNESACRPPTSAEP